MEFDEIAKKAYKKEGIDNLSNLPTKFAYFQLEDLYYRYKIGDVSKDESIKIKNQIRKEYQGNLLEYNTNLEQYKIYNNNRIKNSMLLAQLEKTEDKDKMIELSLRIIANCISDNSIVERNLQKIKKIDI